MAQALMSQSGPSFRGKKVFPTPLPVSEFLVIELVERTLPDYVELAYGTAHPDTTLFPAHKLSFQRELNENFVERWYAKDRVETAQETYNWDLHYSGDANAYPIYPRNYLIPRASYAVEAKLTVDPVQGVAKLVKEDLAQVQDERLTGLYVAVQKIYETLPGPWLYDSRDDLLLGPIQRQRRAVAVTSPPQTSSTTSTTKTTYESRDGSAIVAWEILETSSDGSGGGGGANPAFPILTEYDQDEEMLSLITTTFQVVLASAVSAPTAVAGTITRYKRIDRWRSLKIVTVYAIPADYSIQRFSGQNFPNLLNTFYHSDDCGTILDQRGAFSAMVEIRIDVSFSTTFALVSGLTLIPNSFAWGSFRVSDVLNDADTFTATGACAYSLPVSASSPSKSTYLAYGSTKQLVSGEVDYWKARIFKTVKLFVKML